MTSQDDPAARGLFTRQIFIDHDDLVGARWWQESVRAPPDAVSRRRALLVLAMFGGTAATAVGFALGAIRWGENRPLP